MFSIARTNFAARLSCVALIRSLCVILLFAVLTGNVLAQESKSSHAGPVTPLSDLLAEAEKNNPQIEAARQGWQAAKQVPTQVSTLPDPQFNLQHVSVGSPRPFAGYTNSDFAYLGLGVSQDIPYPGKLRLKGEIPKRSRSSNRTASCSGKWNRQPTPATVPAWERSGTSSRRNYKKRSCFAKSPCTIFRLASSKPSLSNSSIAHRDHRISSQPISPRHLSRRPTTSS